MPETKTLTMSQFAALIGQTFLVEPLATVESLSGSVRAVVPVEFTLVSVDALKYSNPFRSEPFSLIFEGNSTLSLDQGTYTFRNPALGTQEIFIVPNSQTDQIRRYQAIFN
jgi:hypothetical protein